MMLVRRYYFGMLGGELVATGGSSAIGITFKNKSLANCKAFCLVYNVESN
jgi:hypothetical protein